MNDYRLRVHREVMRAIRALMPGADANSLVDLINWLAMEPRPTGSELNPEVESGYYLDSQPAGFRIHYRIDHTDRLVTVEALELLAPDA